MKLEYSQHAQDVMRERLIERSWVEKAVSAPVLRTPDTSDQELERFYAPIQQSEGRVLRVVVNTSSAPWRVVTVFFDRGMRVEL